MYKIAKTGFVAKSQAQANKKPGLRTVDSIVTIISLK